MASDMLPLVVGGAGTKVGDGGGVRSGRGRARPARGGDEWGFSGLAGDEWGFCRLWLATASAWVVSPTR
jgi:hypothetical protein